MRILLVTPDSKFPNLAMMKLYAYHKSKGDEIGFNVQDPELIYLSILFSKNKYIAESIKLMHPGIRIVSGGPGYDPRIKLPAEIECLAPAHDLYPDTGVSYGRVTSGCIRRCGFCVVPLLEPDGIRYIMHPEKIWKPGTILRLFDDNILALPRAWEIVYNFCKENKIVLRMEYFDIRLVTGQIASQIADLRHKWGEVWFSWDITKDEKFIIRGINNLIDAGMKPYRLRCLLYIHDESWIPDAKYRYTILRELGVLPFIMVNPDAYNSHNLKRLRWIVKHGSRPAAIKSMTVDEVFR